MTENAQPDYRWWGGPAIRRIATITVDEILAKVFRGQKDHLREQMLDVAAKAHRKPQTWAWDTAMADAWDAGAEAGDRMARAVNAEWPEPTPNPYRVTEEAP